MAPISHNGTSPHGNRRARQLGFSLLELLVALTIVALLGAALSPLLLPTPARTIHAAAGEIVVALRETRRLAQSERQPRHLVVDTEALRFGIDSSERWRALPPDSTAEITTAQSLIGEDNTGAIAFFPDGSSSGGRVKLGLDGHIAQVDVDWLTGRIRLADDSP